MPAQRTPRKTLADEIRESEQPFVDAATKVVMERVREEYRRLRGYAIEAGRDQINLRLTLSCTFAAGEVAISLSSKPEFTPPPETSQLVMRF